MPIDWNIVELIISIIGAVTGVASLIWHFFNSKPKIKLESVIFNNTGTGLTRPRGFDLIGIKINIRNKGQRQTTIENLIIKIGSYTHKHNVQEKNCTPDSSKLIEFDVPIPNNEFGHLFEKGEIRLGIEIQHTFGNIKKSRKTDFLEGEFKL